MRRNPTILSLFVSALAMPGVANAAIEPETKVALDTVWVLVAAFLVFCLVILGERRLRNDRDRALSREERGQQPLAKNFIVFAVSSLAFWHKVRTEVT